MSKCQAFGHLVLSELLELLGRLFVPPTPASVPDFSSCAAMKLTFVVLNEMSQQSLDGLP